MPIYEYSCQKCDAVFEARLAHADAPKPVCPTCGAKRVKKLFSAFAVAVGGGANGGFDPGSLPPCQGGTGGGCAGGSCPMV